MYLKIIFKYLYLMYLGSILGFVLEVFYRRFKKSNTERRWIKPGFLIGPYIPLYGFGLCILYSVSYIEDICFEAVHPFLKIPAVFIITTILMTVIELIAGFIFIVHFKVKLWDYSKLKFNYKGIICLKFSLIWGALGSIYYLYLNDFFIHSIERFESNIYFLFILGIFYGIMLVDFFYSINVGTKIREYAKDQKIVIAYEHLKEAIRQREEAYTRKKKYFVSILSSRNSLSESLKKEKNADNNLNNL